MNENINDFFTEETEGIFYETDDLDESPSPQPVIIVSVSSGDAYDDTALIESVDTMHEDITSRLDYLTEIVQTTPEPIEQYTLWNAPLDAYSVTDGLLLLTLLVLLAMFAKSFFGGMIWHR